MGNAMASQSNNKQFIDQIGNMTVFQLAELIKELEQAFGVSAAAMAAPAAAAAPAEETKKAEEKSEYVVKLVSGGPDKIKTIKALRQVTTLGLTEAKKAVEEAPTVLAEAAPKDEAKKMKEALEAVGAKVELS
jgi:large subunit ribosomal protein L7/L12